MPKVMLINVTHAEESRVGIVADGVLVSFEIESFSREHLKGNIYKGVVHRVQPALEAAFVDIGAERDAFLPLDEICFRNLVGPIRNGNGSEGRRRPRIQDVLKNGEEILVQIVKEQFGNKPPTLSTFYSLPGRYLVLLPGSDEAGISRRIEGSERQRIRALIEKLNPPEGFGIIVRTVAGFDQGAHELQRDLSYLLRLWESIQQTGRTKRGPALVYREHDLVLRNIRDYFTPDVDEIHIDNEEVCQRAREFLRDVMPGKEDVLHFYQGDQPIFSHFNVEQQIESIYKRRVPLKSGGSIVIDGTEALTAIDVNSGRSVRGTNQEDTAVRTNLEAAAEIARQLRLRDQGGLIVIDFIDMRNAQHINEVEKALRTAMHEDKARHETGRISQFGLLEVSRQRLRPAAAATSYVACAMCDGYGLVRTTESAALVALRKIHIRVAHGDAASVNMSLPRDVGLYLLNQKREDLAQLERRYATRIQIVLREDLMPHQSEIEVRARVEGEQREQPQLRLGGVAAVEVSATPAAADNGTAEAVSPAAPSNGVAAAAAAEPSGKRRRRRRGRRRGAARHAANAIGEGLSALAGHTSLAIEPAAVPAMAVTDRGSAGEDWDDDEAEDDGADEGVTEEGGFGSAASADQSAAVDLVREHIQSERSTAELSSPTTSAATEDTVPAEASPTPAARRSQRGRGGPGRRSPGQGSRKKSAPKPRAAAAAPATARPDAPRASVDSSTQPKRPRRSQTPRQKTAPKGRVAPAPKKPGRTTKSTRTKPSTPA